MYVRVVQRAIALLLRRDTCDAGEREARVIAQTLLSSRAGNLDEEAGVARACRLADEFLEGQIGRLGEPKTARALLGALTRDASDRQLRGRSTETTVCDDLF